MSDVRLSLLAESDLDDVMTWVNDPDVVGNFGWFTGTPITREAEAAYLARACAACQAPTGSERVFTVRDAGDGRYLGQVGLHQIHWPSRVARIALIIAHKTDHGRGYGSAALRALVTHAFQVEKLHKLWMMFFRTNGRTRHLAEKLGFVEEGVLREEYLYKGGYHDMVRVSLLEREFVARP
jgi:RimJ/RimL family protein N-acetyltransferase